MIHTYDKKTSPVIRLLPFLLLGVSILFSSNSIAGHWEDVFAFQMKVATMGSISGQFRVAEMYEEGRGVGRDLDKAIEWYEKAARQNHREARRRMEAIRAGNPRPAFAQEPDTSQATATTPSSNSNQENERLRREKEALKKERERIDAEKKRIAMERAKLEQEKQRQEEARQIAIRKQLAAEAMKKMMSVPDALSEE